MPHSSFRKNINDALVEIVRDKLQLVVLLGAVQEDNAEVKRLEESIDRGIDALATLPETQRSSLDIYNPVLHKEALAQYTAEMGAWVGKSRGAFIKHSKDLFAARAPREGPPVPSDFAAQSKQLIRQLQSVQRQIHYQCLKQNSPKFESFLDTRGQEKRTELLAMASKLREPDREQEELERLERAIKEESDARAAVGPSGRWPPVERLLSEIDQVVRISMERESISELGGSYSVAMTDIAQARSGELKNVVESKQFNDQATFLATLYTANASEVR
ncbi:hypothetical protein BD779DRAFT_391935 [Infundibulicybe gibba]|nr:hypothetical protein BD779DRAFT_391935 [Infundibulicybe gibba]